MDGTNEVTDADNMPLRDVPAQPQGRYNTSISEQTTVVTGGWNDAARENSKSLP